jgi:hypothetical protein
MRMVEAVNPQQSSAIPVAAARNNSPVSGTQVFSISSAVAAPAAARTVADPSTVPATTTTSQDTSGADDFRQLFGNPLPAAVPFSATNPPLPYGYPDPSTAAATPASPASGSAAVAPATAFTDDSFVPGFQGATVTDGTNVWPTNHDYFATQATAQWIANKYGTGQLVTTPFEGSGGPFSASASEYQIVLANGSMVNAGILASYYERNPESQFPGLADTLIRNQLGLA